MSPLTGVTVIDLTDGMVGAVAGRLMADYGASLVTVRRSGPSSRHFPAYALWEAGARRLEVDLDDPDDRREIADLLVGADVVFEDLDDAERVALGLDRAAVQASGLIVCHVSAFGDGHPDNMYPPRGPVVAAELGLMADQPAFRDGPAWLGFPMVEYGTAVLLAIGATAALFARGRGDGGDSVDVSMLAGALAQLGMDWSIALDAPDIATMPNARERTQHYRRSRRRIVNALFMCADDRYIGVHTGAPGAFDRLMRLLGLDDRVAPAPGVGHTSSLSEADAEVLADELESAFRTRPSAEWLDALWGADIAALPVHRPGEARFDEHVRATRLVEELDHPEFGRIVKVRPPVEFVDSGTPDRTPRSAPATPRSAPASSASADGPLRGVRIVDFGTYFAGPMASRMLAEMGADVVKVEAPSGDPNRGLVSLFEGAQRGKRAVAIDMKDPRGQEALQRLAKSADVVQHNLRPGVADRLGADVRRLRELNPSLVYLESPGFGLTGPMARLQSFAPLHSGFSGIFFTSAGQGNPPIRSLQSEDYWTGLFSAFGILLALFDRQRTGAGHHIVCSQLATALTVTQHAVVGADGRVIADLTIDADQLGYHELDRLYRSLDGWVCVSAPTPDELPALVEATGASSPEQLERCIATLPAAEVLDACRRVGIAACVARSESGREQFLRDPENVRSGRVVELRRQDLGRILEIGPLLRFAGQDVGVRGAAPALGEHTYEVLREVGYSPSELAELNSSGVIRGQSG
jgi:crotonobetainyl-CoA:carnitine CoA-transferase CaiB-like acyl-CoA transferase